MALDRGLEEFGAGAGSSGLDSVSLFVSRSTSSLPDGTGLSEGSDSRGRV